MCPPQILDAFNHNKYEVPVNELYYLKQMQSLRIIHLFKRLFAAFIKFKKQSNATFLNLRGSVTKSAGFYPPRRVKPKLGVNADERV
jgi:hypothetical protein